MLPVADPRPGTVVWVPALLVYRHRGLVTDRYTNGKPFVLTTSPVKGVVEEPWDVFGSDSVIHIEGYLGTLPCREVLRRARRHLGRAYDLFGFNCDHLVADAHDLPVQSAQLRGTLAAMGLLALYARAFMYLSGATS
jgi:hypothetical protein